MQKIICVSGQMAAGKNAVSSLFEKYGFIALDFDKLGHVAIENEETMAKILQEFGPLAKQKNIELLTNDGFGKKKFNRRALGALIFKNPELVKKQENIVYPAITKMAKNFVKKNPEKNIIFNATVLYKIPELMEMCSATVFVTAPFFTRLKRAKLRDGLPFLQIFQRFKSQKDLGKFYKNFGGKFFILKNDSDLKKLAEKVRKLSEMV